MKAVLFSTVLAVATAMLAPALAHHSFAMYDRERTVVLSGTVKAYSWTSPHVGIELITDRPGGSSIDWQIEGSSPTVLARSGWSGMLLKPGDKVLIGVHPRKDGTVGGLLADEQQIRINCQTPKGVLWLQPLPEVFAANDCAAAN